MARRALEEINAGSMADIAFLLLIFFLVTTTMDTDEGIVRTLPQRIPPEVEPPKIDIRERDVFEVLANSNDQLLVENNYVQIEELRDLTKEYLTNPSNRADLPEMLTITVESAQAKLNDLKAAYGRDSLAKEAMFIKADIQDWEDKLAAAEKVGPYRTLPKVAMISLRNDIGTSYKLYIQVQNELQAAINDLRNEWSQKVYRENYTDWSSDRVEDQDKIRVIRAIIPQRIAEQEPKNIPSY